MTTFHALLTADFYFLLAALIVAALVSVRVGAWH